MQHYEKLQNAITFQHWCLKLDVEGTITYEVIELFSIYLSLPSALSPRVYSASNRNEYQKRKTKYFWGVEHGRLVRLTT
jgi:hypothetical protein